MELQTKKSISFLVGEKNDKVGDRCNIVSYEKNTKDLLKIFWTKRF
jgi:hypothetical protein